MKHVGYQRRANDHNSIFQVSEVSLMNGLDLLTERKGATDWSHVYPGICASRSCKRGGSRDFPTSRSV